MRDTVFENWHYVRDPIIEPFEEVRSVFFLPSLFSVSYHFSNDLINESQRILLVKVKYNMLVSTKNISQFFQSRLMYW